MCVIPRTPIALDPSTIRMEEESVDNLSTIIFFGTDLCTNLLLFFLKKMWEMIYKNPDGNLNLIPNSPAQALEDTNSNMFPPPPSLSQITWWFIPAINVIQLHIYWCQIPQSLDANHALEKNKNTKTRQINQWRNIFRYNVYDAHRSPTCM